MASSSDSDNEKLDISTQDIEENKKLEISTQHSEEDEKFDISTQDSEDNEKLDISTQDSEGNTPLHQIVVRVSTYYTTANAQLEEKDIHNLKLMLEFNPDVNIKNEDGYTSVHLAIKNKRSDALVQVLLDHGAECDNSFHDEDGCSVLYHAVSPLSYKLSGRPSNYFNWNFKFRDGSVIQHLIENGAKIDTAADNGYSPLLLAVIMRKTDFVKIMLEREAKSEGGLEETIDTYCCEDNYPPKEYYDITPLQIAVYDDNLEMAQILISAGADVNAEKAPLLISVYNGNLKMAQILLSAGAHINGEKENGDNALHMITKCKVKRTYATEQITKFLIDSGIDLNAKDESGETALQLALRKGQKDIVTHILEKGLAAL